MSAIAIVQTDDRNIQQLQQNIKQAVDPVIQNPLVNGQLKKNLTMVAGTNTIMTGLNREIQGYLVVRNRAASTYYDIQDSNPIPTKTLILVFSAPTVIDVYIF